MALWLSGAKVTGPMLAFYNENDAKAAAWLRELIKQDNVAPGEVDETSIKFLYRDDLKKFTRVHLFAGIGGWDLALNMAGWPLDRPVWTGSCPCQPFSNAGKRKGAADDRHLWPYMLGLIDEFRPPEIFGEQVASKPGREWLAGVRADLEALGYVVGAADLCAAGVGAPHIRQRLWWYAGLAVSQRNAGGQGWASTESTEGVRAAEARASTELGRRGNLSGGLGNTDDAGPQGRELRTGGRTNQLSAWAAGVFIACADGRQRRVEPGIFPLAHGIPGRVGLLRGYGNAIVPEVAVTFIRAFL